MFREVDECIYSRYKNGDLSEGCSTAVSSFIKFVYARRSGLQQNVFATTQSIQHSLPAAPDAESHATANEGTLLQTLSEIHQRFKDDSNIRYLLCATILSSILVVTSLCILASKSIWSFFAAVVIIVAGIFTGPIFMLALMGVAVVMTVFDQFCTSNESEEQEEEQAGDFDYVKLEEDKEDNDASNPDVQMNKPEHRVFIGVPVQVV